jgi:hypothetical protein
MQMRIPVWAAGIALLCAAGCSISDREEANRLRAAVKEARDEAQAARAEAAAANDEVVRLRAELAQGKTPRSEPPRAAADQKPID